MLSHYHSNLGSVHVVFILFFKIFPIFNGPGSSRHDETVAERNSSINLEFQSYIMKKVSFRSSLLRPELVY